VATKFSRPKETRSVRRLVVVPWALAGLTCAFAARAGDDTRAEPSVQAEEVVVPLPRAEAPGDPTAAATIVDATRFAGEAKGVAELVATAPGVAVNDYGGLGHLSTVSIRGASAQQVKVLLDGIPLAGPGGGVVDLSSIPRAWIDHVEIVRGAEGAHYGAGSLGGVVNVVTRPAAAGAWSAEATGGSFMTFGVAGDAAVGGERWAALGAATLEGTDGGFPYLSTQTPLAGGPLSEAQRSNNAVYTGGALAKGWLAVGDGRLDTLLQLSGGHRQLPGWPVRTPNDWEEDARLAATARLTQPLGARLLGSLQATARLERLDIAIQQLGPRSFAQRDLATAADGELALSHTLGVLTGRVSAGVERLDGDGLGEHARPELAATLAEEAVLLDGRLRLAPALRLEKVGPYAGVSGKLGAVVRLAGPLSVRASAGRTFRPPSFGELFLQQGILEPNPDLRSETALTGDAALVAEGALGLVSAGAFASAYQDLIVYEPGSFQRLKPFNDGKAAMRGLELEAASAPARRLLGLSGAVAYTLLASETLRGDPHEVGKDLPFHPRHRLYARAALEQPDWGAHVEVHRVSSQFADPRNERPFAGTTTLNAGATLRLASHPDVRLAVEAKNLLDDRQLLDAYGNPLPARTLLFTVRVSNPDRG
jgi:iron complex outermembrane receptor protein